MTIDPQFIVTVVTSLGFGGLVTLIIKSRLDSRQRRLEDEFNHKEKRYKAIMVQMWACINPEGELYHLQQFRPDIKDANMLKRELQLELYNGILYASDDVLKQFKTFITEPSYKAYLSVALAMRKDLYGKKSNLSFDDIHLKELN